jgi:sugar lactone lactonase YvrE
MSRLCVLAFAVLLGKQATLADTIYISNAATNAIDRINPNGTITRITASSLLHFPGGLCTDTNTGTLYICDNSQDGFGNDNSRIARMDVTGSLSIIAPDPKSPNGLAFRGGVLYVANDDSPQSITIINLTNLTISTVSPSGLNGPAGLAFDNDGYLYVANNGNNTVEKYGFNGVTPTNGVTFASSGLNAPYCLAFDKSTNLFVSNVSGNSIEKYSPQGTDLGAFVSSGLNQPVGLAFDSVGNLYVADQGNNVVKKYPFVAGQLSTNATTIPISGYNLPYIIAVQPPPWPVPLLVQRFGTNVVLSWTNNFAMFSLQASPLVNGPYTNVPSANSPYTNQIRGSSVFFRLISQ